MIVSELFHLASRDPVHATVTNMAYKPGTILNHQRTDDHSTVAEMQRRGIITSEEARTHPERSRLYRALGIRPEAEVDMIDDVHVGRNEFYLLCTDGLINHVTEDEMQETVLKLKPEEAVTRLVELANERGGSDNITVQIIQVNPSDSFIARLLG